MSSTITFDQDKCINCLACVDVCPHGIFEADGQGVPVVIKGRDELCFHCAQCMAVCPTDAVSVSGMLYAYDLFPWSEATGDSESFYHLIKGRRSIRSFQNKPVEHAVLKKLTDVLSFAPIGFPPARTELVISNHAEILKQASTLIAGFYDRLLVLMRNPFARRSIRKTVGNAKYLNIKNNLLPTLPTAINDWKSKGIDHFLRNAPALVLFVTDREGEDNHGDLYVAATYMMLAAHAEGLGSTMMDVIPPAINRTPALRKLFRINERKEVVCALIVGYPQHQYPKGITRRMKQISWI